MSQQQHTYLSAMGITVWQYRSPQQPFVAETTEQTSKNIKEVPATSLVAELLKPTNTPDQPSQNTPKTSIPVTKPIDCSAMNWDKLTTTVAECTQCTLAKSRNQAVFGMGDQQAELMIIGDTPSDEDDRLGQPFKGHTGQLLSNMLMAIQIPLHKTYITNVLKCRPPTNRDPESHEVSQCSYYIQKQIQLVKPKLILAVGRTAAQALLKENKSLAQLRGITHTLPEHDIPIIITYHPNYLLRQKSAKRKAWEDLKRVRSLMSHE